ncbi:MAG TPA: cytochrome c [Kofleriaceae bacterium]|jgi:cytochrome c553
MRRLLFVLALAAACGKNNEPPPPSSGSPNAKPESGPSSGHRGMDPAEKAQEMFATVCAMCHGPTGQGDGQAAASLNPKPRNYTDAKWQASVTDDQIRQTILQGGQAMGKSPMMPGQPQLKNEPAVLDELVKIIRGFGKK